MKAEDKFYFGKPGQPEKFLRIDPRSVEQWEASARQRIDSVGPTVWIFVDPSGKEIWLPRPMRFREAVGWLNANQPGAKPNDYYKVAMSRPGQPERFDMEGACWEGYEPVGTKQKDGRTVPNCVPMKNAAGDEENFADVGSNDNKIRYLLGEAESAVAHLPVAEARKMVADYIRKAESLVEAKTPAELTARIRRVKSMAARHSQPEKFDASSLDRGSFAEASTSPMLGKLLAAKVMPEGGWRAVQAGSDTLVISFEDADLARDFGRRVATKGYNATSPVQAIGRYWNVEVKNGK